MNEVNFLEKFKRQICIESVGLEGQEKILKSRVLVIGAGGLGSPVLTYLAMMGVGHIGICDEDLVDISNLHRQGLYGEKDVSMRKVEIARKKILELSSFCKVDTFSEKISSKNYERIMGGFDIVVDCTDNFKAKFLIHDACFLLKKDLVQSSIYQYEGSVHTFQFSKGLENPCYRCLWPEVIDDSCVGSCAEVGVLGVVPGIFGPFQALEVIKLILALPTLKAGESFIFDLLSLESAKHSWERSPNCPLCSKSPSIEHLDSNLYEKQYDFELRFDEVKKLKDLVWIDIREEMRWMSFRPRRF